MRLPFNPPRTEARIVLVLLAVQAVVRGVLFGFAFAAVAAGVSPEAVSASENLAGVEGVILLAIFGVMALTGLTWIIWLRTCYANLPALGERQRYKMWWTVGGWLIPFVSLVVPKQLTDDTLVATSSQPRRSVLVYAWWGLFLTDQIAIAVSLVIGTAAGVAVTAAWSVAALAVAALLVVTVTEAQVTRRAELTGDHVEEGRGLLKLEGVGTTVAALAGVALAAAGTFGPWRAFVETEGERGDLIDAGDLVPGDCFNLGESDEFAGVFRVSCDEPHNGQSLGHVVLDGSDYPGRDRVVMFTSEACREMYEVTTGFPGAAGDPPIRLLSPLEAEWLAGNRRVDCVLHVPEGRTWTERRGSPADRVRLRELDVDRCYATDVDYVTYRDVECSQADFRVDAVKLYPMNATLDYPDEATIAGDIAATCSEGGWVEPFPPLEEFWEFGGRVLLCAAYDLPESVATLG